MQPAQPVTSSLGVNAMSSANTPPAIDESLITIPDIPEIKKAKNDTFTFPLQVLNGAIEQMPNIQKSLLYDLHFLGKKIGVPNASDLSVEDITLRESNLMNWQRSIGRPLNQIDLTNEYRLKSKEFENIKNNMASLQMAIELLSNNS